MYVERDLCPMCEDRHTTVQQMRDWVAQFVDERDWRPFHSPKNLAMGMAIEAAELMEHFQWISTEESWQVVSEPGRLQPVVEELADVVCYALAMANVLGIDLSRAVREKLEKNAQKYPASEYRGRYGPEDQRPPY